MHKRGVFADRDLLTPRILLRVKNQIGLSEDQEKRITTLVKAHQLWAIKFEAEMRIKALKLRSLVDGNDLKAAEKLIREQADMHAEKQIARLHLRSDIRALLTPEQIAKMAELKKDFRARARDGMGQRFERRRDRRN